MAPPPPDELRTPPRPAVWAGLAGGLLVLPFCLAFSRFLGSSGSSPGRDCLAAIADLLRQDFRRIRWDGRRYHCWRTFHALEGCLGGGPRTPGAASLVCDPGQLTLVWEGGRLMLLCDGLPGGIYLGRGAAARRRAAWFQAKGMPPPLRG